jgi:hypothetical protein
MMLLLVVFNRITVTVTVTMMLVFCDSEKYFLHEHGQILTKYAWSNAGQIIARWLPATLLQVHMRICACAQSQFA